MSSKHKYIFYKYDSMGNLNFLEYNVSPEGDIIAYGNSSVIDSFVYSSDKPISPKEDYDPVEINIAKVMLL